MQSTGISCFGMIRTPLIRIASPPEAVKARHRYAYQPFGAGPRICIGMSFALLEAVVILATLLRSVHPSLRPGYVPELKQRITLRPAAGMPMRLERRTHNPMTHTVS